MGQGSHWHLGAPEWISKYGVGKGHGLGAPPPQQRVWLSEAAEWALEDSRMIWPEFLLRHRRTQVPTRKDSMPYKSYPQVGDDSTHGSRTPHSLSPRNIHDPKSPMHRGEG